MALNIDDLYSRAVGMSKNIDDNFLDLGRTLRQLLDKDPERFNAVWEKSDLGRRKAYYLVTISRAFEPLQVSRARLKKIGWTKLEIISKHVTQDNVEELLETAEANNVKQLTALMKGETPMNNAHCMLMYFSPKQYAVIEDALIKNGAQRSGQGFVNKEEALVKALSKT